jgi:hypothetical protein
LTIITASGEACSLLGNFVLPLPKAGQSGDRKLRGNDSVLAHPRCLVVPTVPARINIPTTFA